MMTNRAYANPSRTGIIEAAERYGDYLRADFPELEASSLTRQHFRDLVPNDSTTDWDWARFLAAYERWRPHRIAILLNERLCQTLAERCRAQVVAHSGQPRKRGLLPIKLQGENSQSLLSEIIAILEKGPQPTNGDKCRRLEELAKIGRELDAAIAAIPPDDPAVRLAYIGQPIADDWPPQVNTPSDPPSPFLPVLIHLLENGLQREKQVEGQTLFQTLVQEHLRLPVDPQMNPSRLSNADLAPIITGETRDLPAILYCYYAGRGRPKELSWILCKLAWQFAHLKLPGIEPPLDPVKLAVLPGYRPPAASDVLFQVSDLPAREIINVRRFSVSPQYPSVEVSLGGAPSRLSALLLAPSELDSLPAGRGRNLLEKARGRAISAFWSGEADPPTDSEWLAWMTTPEAMEWFHKLVVSPHPDSIRWMVALQAWADLHLYPIVQPDGRLAWPDESTYIRQGASFREDSSAPGTIISVERFAVRPEGACYILSSGPPGANRSARAAADLWELAKRSETLKSLLNSPLVKLVESAVFKRKSLELDTLVGTLDCLTGLDPQRTSVAESGAALNYLRELASGDRIDIHPVCWDFISEILLSARSGPGVAVKPVFRAKETVGTISRVRLFALTRDSQILRPGEIVVSAGPPPERVSDLDRMAESLAGPGADELRSKLRGLRDAGLGRYLEESAVRLYYHYWEQVRPSHMTMAPEDAEEFTEALAEMLSTTCGLTEFRPVNFRNHPEGWVRIPPGSRVQSGRVTRLIAPGLIAYDGELRAPAYTEVD